MTEVVTEQVTDGRRARRERGRLAVVDAMVDLVQEGGLVSPPSAQEIADRAGVSVSSLFRYFDNLDELRHETILRFFERYADLFEVPGLGEGGLDERIGRFVAARLHLYGTVAPSSRLVRARALEAAELAANVEGVRRRQAAQVRAHFAPELDARTPAVADDLVAIIASLTSFEAWDLAHETLGRTPRQLTRSWTAALAALLGP